MSLKASRDKVVRREAISLDASATLSVRVRGVAKKQENPEAKNMSPRNIKPVQWQQALGYARQACARIFRDGGTPAAALVAFGLREEACDWATAVERVAQALCATPLRRAA